MAESKKFHGLLWVLPVLTMFVGEAVAATCTSVQTGNWNTTSTWNCTGATTRPGVGDTVIIVSPHTVTLDGNRSATNLQIDAGATLNDGNGRDLTLSGNAVINGIYDATGNNGNLTMTGNGVTLSGTGTIIDINRIEIDGDITIPAGSNLKLTQGSEIRVGNNNPGTLTIDGMLDGTGMNNGARLIRLDNGNTSNVIVNGTINAPNSYIEIQQGGTVQNNGSVSIAFLDGNGDTNVTWTQGANSTLSLSQPTQGWNNGTFNASANGNTVNFNGTATPFNPATYYNIAGVGVTCPHPAGITVLGTSPCAPPPGSTSVTASPTGCVNDASIGSQAWGTLTGPFASDNSYATASITNSQITNFLKCIGYNFGIPSNATITGIALAVENHSRRTINDYAAQLVKGGVIQPTNYATNTRFPSADAYTTYGGASDLWGGVWTAADINDANFGVAFAAQRGPFNTVDTAFVDHMPITVTYTLPSYPSVLSIDLAGTNPTNPNTSVDWTVTFSQSVTGVDATDFALVSGGGVTGASITGVTGGGTTWTVTANTGSGIGTLGLNLVDDDTIAAGALKLGGTGAGNGNFTGQVYDVSPVLTCITDSFTAADNSAPDPANWNANKVSGSFTPVIFGNRLRITDISGSAATRVTNKNLFPFGNNLVVAEFDYWAYGGTGADGIAITFSDPDTPTPGANNPPTTGGFGGSLGYANRDTGGVCNVPGFTGGWIGVGIDEYGNYSNPTECRNGGPGFLPNAVAMRGSGSGATSPSASNYAYLTGTAALGANSVSSGTTVTPYRYRITLDSLTDLAKVMVKVELDKTGTGYLPLFSYDLKPMITAGTQAALPPRLQFTYTGSTGGSTNYHEVDNLSICAASIIPASGPHHLEIQHASGTEVTCNPSTLTIKACADALAPCTPYTGGVSGTLSATGAPTVNWDGTTGGAAGAGFDIPNGSSSVTKNVQVTTVGTTVFDATGTPAATAATTCNFGAPACTFTATDSAFIVTAPDHAAETASTLTIQAVKSVPGNPLLCTTGMTGAKTVNLKCSYVNPASGILPVRIGGTPLAADAVSACSAGGVDMALTFNASGVAAPTLQYADVGQMLISASFTGTPGSVDEGLVLTGGGNFIAAPASFDFSSFAAGTLKAGDPFSATVRALNAAGAVAPNFGKESEGVTLASSLVTPDPGTYPAASNPAPGNNVIPGTEFGAGGMVSDANGVATVDNLSWGEVGSITLAANLTSGSYLGSGLTATGTSATVGPFIPHHFDTVVVASSSVPMPCPAGLTCPALYDGFVYSGQPFSMQVFARNLAGGTTVNYDGTFGLSRNVTLTAWDALGGATQNPGSGVLGSNAVVAAAFGSGAATLTDTPTYTFGTSPTAPTDIYLRADDTDGVSSLRAVPVEGGVKVASGRVKIGNAHGSELLPLPMSATVQYHNGTNWLTSLTDSVTSLTLGLFNYQCKTGCAWTTTPTPAGGQVIAGILSFKLSKPTGGGTGSVDVSITTPNYLLAGSNGAAVNPSKAGRATFGVFKGNNEFIYLRETY